MCTKVLWDQVLPYLNDSFELVYLEIPQGKNFDELAAYYRSVLNVGPVNLIGFSLGGYIATYLATQFPECVLKLLVISNSPTCLPPEEVDQRMSILAFIKQYGYKGMSRKKIESLLDSSTQTEHLINTIMAMDSDLGESELVSQYQYTSLRRDLASAIIELPFRTSFYYSENDPLLDLKWLAELEKQSASVSLHSTKGRGHYLPLEKPKELAGLIHSWAVAVSQR